MSRYTTELEACRAWIAQWDSIPGALVEKAYRSNEIDQLELLAGGQKLSECCDADVEHRVVKKANTGQPVPCCAKCQQRLDRYVDDEGVDTVIGWRWTGSDNWPAMWGTLFHPAESLDEDWIRSNPDVIAACGFLVYDSDEAGILLGIDGAGYDFYAAHWLPLYRARGLQWHAPVEPDLPKRKLPAKKSTAGSRSTTKRRRRTGASPGGSRRVKSP